MSVSFPACTMYFSNVYELAKATQTVNIKLHWHSVKEIWRFSKYVSYLILRWHFKPLDPIFDSRSCLHFCFLVAQSRPTFKSNDSKAQWDNSLITVSSPTNVYHCFTTISFLSFLITNSPGRKHVDKSSLFRSESISQPPCKQPIVSRRHLWYQ